jgi:superfamily II DNA or RNA helicase
VLVAKQQKKLLLNLSDPVRITAIVPGAVTVNIKGHDIVSVPHDQDTVRVLRNMGIKAPGPITEYYDWSGMYTPFIHQKETAEFASLNPRGFILNDMGCIAGDEKVRVSRKGRSYETTLAALHDDFQKMPDKGSWKVRSLMDGRFGMNPLVDTLSKGPMKTLRFTLADGKTFRCTPDHVIARPGGTWTDAGKLVVGDALVTNGAVEVACIKCGAVRTLKMATPRSKNQQCRACKNADHSARMRGDSNPHWIGGRWIDPDGYVRKLAPTHHRADTHGYVYEHILIAEGLVGHPITVDWHVHHRNANKADNSPENLEVLLASDHHRKHDPRIKLDGSVSAKGGVVVVLPKESVIVSIEDGGFTPVYDLSMKDPHNNYVVNGVVVHNTGKTISVLWAFDYLRKLGEVDWCLVVSPLSTLERVWADEVFKHFPDMSYGVVYGTADRRTKIAQDPYDLYIINHDGIKSKRLLELFAKKPGKGLIIIDEIASAARNASTDKWKALNTLVNGNAKLGLPPKEWVWGMTGTPIPNEPTDAWAQCKLINPGSGPKFFGAFRDATMKQITQYKWVPRTDALDTVHRYMQPAIRFNRVDCIDLPPTTYTTRTVELTSEQQKLYKEMLKDFKADYTGGQLTAANEAVKLGKLLQICLGCAIGADGELIHIPNKPRTDEVLEIIEQSRAKVIVFVPYTGALHATAEAIRKHHSVAIVNGEVPKKQRDDIFSDFMSPHGTKVLVAQPGTMSHGLTLTCADTIVWMAPTNSAETFQQANARIARPGQKLNTLIVKIQGSDVERRMYERLERRESTQGTLLGMFE